MESFAYPEGILSIWTGISPSSAIAFVQNSNVTITRGIVNQQAVNGNYFNVVTGQRADLSFTPVFTPDISLFAMLNQSTGIHIQLNHVHSGGSAGIFLYSGAFDSLSINGNESNIFTMPITYHANEWSAYGQ